MAARALHPLLSAWRTTALRKRPLMMLGQAQDLVGVFKVLASDTRLRLIHALVRAGELCVTDLATATGMSTQALSNQLQRLVAHGILGSRRDGNNVYYQIIDPCVASLLDYGWCLTESAQKRRTGPATTSRPRR